MTRSSFKELAKSIISNVKIGNGDFTSFKEKWIVSIEILKGLKYIFDILYVPEINQNCVKCCSFVGERL